MATIFLAEVIFHWGFSVRSVGSSAASLPYLIIPPQTLVGALSWGLAKVLGLPEVVNSVSATKLFIDEGVIVWSAARLEGPVAPYSDIVKLERSPYMRERYRKDFQRQFGVSSMGRVYAPSLKATIAYVINVNRLINLIRRVGSSMDPYEALKAAISSIIRIGSKESIVTIDDIKIVEPSNSDHDVVETSFYILKACVEKVVRGRYSSLWVPAYSDEHYAIHGCVNVAEEVEILVPVVEAIAIPVFGGKISLKPRRDRCVILSMNGDALVYPIQGVKGLRYS